MYFLLYMNACVRVCFFMTFSLNFINITTAPLPLLFEFFSRISSTPPPDHSSYAHNR